MKNLKGMISKFLKTLQCMENSLYVLENKVTEFKNIRDTTSSLNNEFNDLELKDKYMERFYEVKLKTYKDEFNINFERISNYLLKINEKILFMNSKNSELEKKLNNLLKERNELRRKIEYITEKYE